MKINIYQTRKGGVAFVGDDSLAAPSSRIEVTALMARSIFAFGEEEASSHLSMATLAIPSRNSGYVI